MAKAYKLFRIIKGKLYPLYVHANEEIPVGEWVEAKNGELADDGKHVKSKLGPLCFRPGFHLADIPNSPWIGQKSFDEYGNVTLLRRKDTVWCECEYSDSINYQETVKEIGRNKKGFVVMKNAFMREIPTNGYYYYKTNAHGDFWIIAGAMRVNKILSDEEVFEICRENGVEPQKVAA